MTSTPVKGLTRPYWLHSGVSYRMVEGGLKQRNVGSNCAATAHQSQGNRATTCLGSRIATKLSSLTQPQGKKKGSGPRREPRSGVDTQRLQCNSFLVMTYFLLRDANILPTKELHLSILVEILQSELTVSERQRLQADDHVGVTDAA